MTNFKKKWLKYTIKDMQKLAEFKGGQFLSPRFESVNKLHKWKCDACGCIWSAKPSHIIGYPSKPEGSWCPKCSSGIGERMVRKFFEIIFKVDFSEERDFPWLRKYNLQIDGYNKDLKLAFERQGIQHYKFIPVFHKAMKDFHKQKERDEYVRNMCRRDRITLIEVGWERRGGKWHKITYDEMEDYIRKNCIQKGIYPPTLKEKIDWRTFDVAHPKFTEELMKIAKARNGRLFSPKYLGAKEPLHWHCDKHNYDWWASPSDIKDSPSRKGTWCPVCGEETRSKSQFEHTIQDLQELAISRGGTGSKILSKEFKGMHELHKWQCAKDHKWSAKPSSIQGTPNQKGSWCPICYEEYGRLSNIQIKILKSLEERGKFVFEIADQLGFSSRQVKTSLIGLLNRNFVQRSIEYCLNSPKYSRKKLFKYILTDEGKHFLQEKENGLYNFFSR